MKHLPLIHIMFGVIQPNTHLHSIPFTAPLKNILHFNISCFRFDKANRNLFDSLILCGSNKNDSNKAASSSYTKYNYRVLHSSTVWFNINMNTFKAHYCNLLLLDDVNSSSFSASIKAIYTQVQKLLRHFSHGFSVR